MELKEKIKMYAQEFASDVVNIRRHLHAHPELSFQERQTAALVAEKLREYGLSPVPMADTGVTALVEGRNPGGQGGCPAG